MHFCSRGDLCFAGDFYVGHIYTHLSKQPQFGRLHWWEDSQVGKAMRGGGSGVSWVRVPALPPFCCVTVDKALGLSEPHLLCKRIPAAAHRDAVRVPGEGCTLRQETLPCTLLFGQEKCMFSLDAVNTSPSQSRRK